MRIRRRKRLEMLGLNSTTPSTVEEETKAPQSQSHLPASTVSTGANLKSLVDICCQQQNQDSEEEEDVDGIEAGLSPVLQDIQHIAATAPAEEVVGFQSALRNLANAWRRGQQPVVMVPKIGNVEETLPHQ